MTPSHSDLCKFCAEREYCDHKCLDMVAVQHENRDGYYLEEKYKPKGIPLMSHIDKEKLFGQ